jgi:hypothetical protein
MGSFLSVLINTIKYSDKLLSLGEAYTEENHHGSYIHEWSTENVTDAYFYIVNWKFWKYFHRNINEWYYYHYI